MYKHNIVEIGTRFNIFRAQCLLCWTGSEVWMDPNEAKSSRPSSAAQNRPTSAAGLSLTGHDFFYTLCNSTGQYIPVQIEFDLKLNILN